MPTARPFPNIKPSSRSYSPGEYPQQQFESLNGVKTTLRYGKNRTNATLSLSFNNITDADAALILNNYEQVNSVYDFVTFSDENATLGINSTSLENFVTENGSGLKYRYSAPPSITSVFPGRSNVSCSFVACLDAP